jgi:hypothetical protein
MISSGPIPAIGFVKNVTLTLEVEIGTTGGDQLEVQRCQDVVVWKFAVFQWIDVNASIPDSLCGKKVPFASNEKRCNL